MLLALSLSLAALAPACGDETNATSNRWDVEGPLLAWDGEIWIVDALPIVVPDDVTWDGTLVPGSLVTASGVYDDMGRRIAEEIKLRAGPAPESTVAEVAFSGEIERIDADVWMVAGREVIVAEGTPVRAIDPGMDPAALAKPGNHAEIAGYELEDGRIVAREIALLGPSQPAAEPEPDPLATDQPQAAPTESPSTEPQRDEPPDPGRSNDDRTTDDDEDKDDGKPDKDSEGPGSDGENGNGNESGRDNRNGEDEKGRDGNRKPGR
jgi:hypothetical protein